MQDAFRVGRAEAVRGTVARGVISVGRAFEGPYEIPVIVLHGAHDGPALWVDGTTHGDEPEGCHVCWRLAREVDPTRLSGTLILVPVFNMGAARNASRGDPSDLARYDLNRIYPGQVDGWPTERLAWAHYQELSVKADVAVSIHSGGARWCMSPVIFHNGLPEAVALAKAFPHEWDLLLDPFIPHGEPGMALADLQKPFLALELGGLAEGAPSTFGANVQRLRDACLNLMRHLEMIPGSPERNRRWKLGRERMIRADVGGFWVVDPSFRLRVPVREGTVLGRIVDAYEQTLQEVIAPCNGEAFGIRTRFSVALPGDWCVFFSEVYDEVAA